MPASLDRSDTTGTDVRIPLEIRIRIERDSCAVFQLKRGCFLATAQVSRQLSRGLWGTEALITDNWNIHPSIWERLSVLCRSAAQVFPSIVVCFGGLTSADCRKVLFQQLLHPLQCLCSFTFSLPFTHTHTHSSNYIASVYLCRDNTFPRPLF